MLLSRSFLNRLMTLSLLFLTTLTISYPSSATSLTAAASYQVPDAHYKQSFDRNFGGSGGGGGNHNGGGNGSGCGPLLLIIVVAVVAALVLWAM